MLGIGETRGSANNLVSLSLSSFQEYLEYKKTTILERKTVIKIVNIAGETRDSFFSTIRVTLVHICDYILNILVLYIESFILNIRNTTDFFFRK